MDDEGVRLPVIAKIEKPQAVDNLEAIVDAFDGIMVARGDLGVELPLEQVPLVQKRADQHGPPPGQAGHRRDPDARLDDVDDAPDARRGHRRRQRRARRRRRPHALGRDLGRRSPGARRAHDGPDHRAGRGRGARPAARRSSTATTRRRARSPAPRSTSAWTSAPPRVIAFTETGRSARLVARYRPAIAAPGLHARTPGCAASSRCAGASRPSSSPRSTSTDEMVRLVDASAAGDRPRARSASCIVIIAGVPPGVPGTTNGMRVHRIGTPVASGI